MNDKNGNQLFNNNQLPMNMQNNAQFYQNNPQPCVNYPTNLSNYPSSNIQPNINSAQYPNVLNYHPETNIQSNNQQLLNSQNFHIINPAMTTNVQQSPYPAYTGVQNTTSSSDQGNISYNNFQAIPPNYPLINNSQPYSQVPMNPNPNVPFNNQINYSQTTATNQYNQCSQQPYPVFNAPNIQISNSQSPMTMTNSSTVKTVTNTSPLLKPTLVAATSFNAENDAKILRSAMKGLGTNEDALIRVLCRRTLTQRIQIAEAFQRLFNRNLSKDIKSETSGSFKEVLLGLLMEPTEFLAVCVNKYIRGLGTNDRELCDVLCTQTNENMIKIKEHYKILFGNTLEKDVTSDTSGDYRKLLLSLCQANREPESPLIDANRAQADTFQLHCAGVGKLGTDEDVFIEMISKRSYGHIKKMLSLYYETYKHNFTDAIESETSGNFCRALKTITLFINDPYGFYSYRVSKPVVLQEFLLRLCVLRAEIDLQTIVDRIEKDLSCSIIDFMRGQVLGDFGKSLMTLLGKDPSSIK